MMDLLEKIKNLEILAQAKLDNNKIAAIILISVALLFIDLNFILKPQFKGFNNTCSKIATIKKDLKELKIGLKKMDELKAKEKSGPQQQLPKYKKIIAENQTASLVQDISKLAKNNNVKINQVNIIRELSSASPQVKAAEAAKLSLRFIIMNLSCGYHNLGVFINELENSDVFVSVQSMKIEAQGEDYLKQKVTLILKTYVKK